MPFDLVMGLFVGDRERYAEYRAAIAPLLEAAGAAFRYDFDVSRTLKSEGGEDLNRLFVLRFPDRGAKERFFSDPDYLSIRSRLFEKSVRRVSIIGEYDAPR